MARRITYTPNRVIDSNGIADGASIFVYLTGTTTLVPIYSDEGLLTNLPNPYVVPAGAAVPTIYHTQTVNIRVKVVNSSGATVSDDDPAPTSPIDLLTEADATLVATLAASDDAQDSRDAAAASAIVAQSAAASAVSVTQAVSDALALGTVSDLVGTRIYTSRALLNADLVPADNLYALVVGDATAANNDLYQKNGATTVGSWDGPLGIFAAASASAQAQAVIATAQANTAIANAALYDRLLDEFPIENRQTIAPLSNAPLLVNYDNGFEVDFTRPYARMIAIKQSGVLTFSSPDSILTNGGTTPVTIVDAGGVEKYAPHNYYGLSAAPVTRTISVVSGRKYTIKTTGDITLTASNAATGVASAGSPLQVTAASTSLILTKAGTSGTAHVYEGHGSVDYIETPTTSARYGVPISKNPITGQMGLMVEPPRINSLLNSHTPATQTVSLAAGTYTLSCKGIGSVALSGGPTGTATEGAPVTFTLGGTTSVTFTVASVLTWFQCELGANATSVIETFGAARSRSLQTIAVATSAIPALGSEWLAFFECRTYAPGNSSAYLFGIDDGTSSNYFRLRSDGVVGQVVGGATLYGQPLPKIPVSGALFNFTLRAKANAVVLVSQGTPAGSPGTKINSIFVPTRVNIGIWNNQAPPGPTYVSRTALLPVA